MTQALTQLIREVRTCFNQLKSLSEQLSAGLGITPSMRAVLEDLDLETGRTVPDLARKRGVSRQHIQTVMNTLADQDLVRAVDNPGHKRSVLYLLTPAGAETFAEVRRREAAPMAALSDALPTDDLARASALLTRLNALLADRIDETDPS